MSREKQIEEMAKILCGMKNGCDGCMWDKVHCNERNYAEEIYNAGYRKQSENMVEVIRCKDCKACEHCYPAKAVGRVATEGWFCNFHKLYVKPDDFCSFAKMKGGAE